MSPAWPRFPVLPAFPYSLSPSTKLHHFECLQRKVAHSSQKKSIAILDYRRIRLKMDAVYGIGVTNRFGLFYDNEEDPLDIIKKQEDEKKKKKELKQIEKENKQKGPPPPKPKQAPVNKKGTKELLPAVKSQEQSVPKREVENNRPPRIQRAPVERNVKFGGNVRDENRDIEEKKNRWNREERPERGPPSGEVFRDRGGDREREPREPRGDGEMRRGRGGGMRGGPGRGRGRGLGRGGGFDNRGKREFDRQSGSDKSGVKAVDKREGGGSHNWGTIKDDIDQLNNAVLSDEPQEWPEKPAEETTEPAEAPKEVSGEPPAEGEEEKPPTDDSQKEMTFEEWKKEQDKARAVPHFNIRKPGEGEDTTQWKKTYVLKKKEEEEEEEIEEEDEDEVTRRGRAKHVVDIEINFSDSRHGRGRGRGGRGAPRGLPRGGFAGGRDRDSTGMSGDAGERGPRSMGVGREERGGGAGGMGGATGPGIGGGGSGFREGREREGPRGGGRPSIRGNKNQSAPKVDDENDFPSLVAA